MPGDTDSHTIWLWVVPLGTLTAIGHFLSLTASVSLIVQKSAPGPEEVRDKKGQWPKGLGAEMTSSSTAFVGFALPTHVKLYREVL